MMNFIQQIRRFRQQNKSNFFGSQNEQVSVLKKLYAKHGLELVITCEACPEQYEVFKNKGQVAYLRLRHGEFRIDSPTCGSKTILYEYPNGDGMFNDDERFKYMKLALDTIKKHFNPDNK